MKGYIRKAPHYYDYYHQKFWIVDNTTVHLSTGVWLCVCVCACVRACMRVSVTVYTNHYPPVITII